MASLNRPAGFHCHTIKSKLYKVTANPYIIIIVAIVLDLKVVGGKGGKTWKFMHGSNLS